VDQPFGVAALSIGVQVDGVLGETAGGVAGDLSAFGGVFGEVSSDHGVGDRIVATQGDHAHVDLLTPSDQPSVRPGLV
jgi:hypothetical protein